MNRIDNPAMYFQSWLNPREMVETNTVTNPDTTYVTVAQYNELKTKYENRGKVIKKLRKKIARLQSFFLSNSTRRNA